MRVFDMCSAAATAMAMIGLAAPAPPALAAGPNPCSCTWINGQAASPVPANVAAVVSHEGGLAPLGIKVADDFYLQPGLVYKLNSISAEMLTSTTPGLVKARLELYSDCNGHPDALLYTFTRPQVIDSGPVGIDNLRRVKFTFVVSEQAGPGGLVPPISLTSGSYWVSVVGLTDGLCPTMNMCDQTAWLPVDSGQVMGRPPQKISGVPTGVYGQYSYAGQTWRPLDECCSGCVDLAFTVCADPCTVLLDNGGPDLARYSKSLSGGSSIVEGRTADDFVVPPCNDRELCYVRGYLATNCTPPRARLDIYDAACNLPATFSPPVSFEASRITNTGLIAHIDGLDLPVYSVEFWDFRAFGPNPLTLQAGLNYWLSIYAVSSGSVSERGYVLGATRCDPTACGPTPIRFNPAAISGLGFGITDFSWKTVPLIGGAPFDLGFIVAVKPLPIPGYNDATPGCPADFNNSGSIEMQDIFDYLNAWFGGC